MACLPLSNGHSRVSGPDGLFAFRANVQGPHKHHKQYSSIVSLMQRYNMFQDSCTNPELRPWPKSRSLRRIWQRSRSLGTPGSNWRCSSQEVKRWWDSRGSSREMEGVKIRREEALFSSPGMKYYQSRTKWWQATLKLPIPSRRFVGKGLRLAGMQLQQLSAGNQFDQKVHLEICRRKTVSSNPSKKTGWMTNCYPA